MKHRADRDDTAQVVERVTAPLSRMNLLMGIAGTPMGSRFRQMLERNRDYFEQMIPRHGQMNLAGQLFDVFLEKINKQEQIGIDRWKYELGVVLYLGSMEEDLRFARAAEAAGPKLVRVGPRRESELFDFFNGCDDG